MGEGSWGVAQSIMLALRTARQDTVNCVEKRAMRNYGRYTRGVAWLLKQCSGSALVCAIVLVSQYYPLCGEIDGKGLEYFITLCASMT